jgi:hypothetical protein
MTKFSPSAALKFFVDGDNSMNLLSLVNHAGVKNEPYFFANPFSNNPPGANDMNDCENRTINVKNIEATQFIFSTGTGHFSEMLQDGTKIGEMDIRFPFELIWEPNQEAFPPSDEDFFTYFANNPGGEDTVLFTLRAWEDPCTISGDCGRTWDQAPIIGKVYLTSELFRSTFGDDRLFFSHEIVNRDIRRLKTQG